MIPRLAPGPDWYLLADPVSSGMWYATIRRRIMVPRAFANPDISVLILPFETEDVGNHVADFVGIEPDVGHVPV